MLTVQKSLRIPKDIIEEIEEVAKDSGRDFTHFRRERTPYRRVEGAPLSGDSFLRRGERKEGEDSRNRHRGMGVGGGL